MEKINFKVNSASTIMRNKINEQNQGTMRRVSWLFLNSPIPNHININFRCGPANMQRVELMDKKADKSVGEFKILKFFEKYKFFKSISRTFNTNVLRKAMHRWYIKIDNNYSNHFIEDIRSYCCRSWQCCEQF